MGTVITPTVVLRVAFQEAVDSGVMGLTTHDINRLIEGQQLTPNENNRHLLTVLMRREFDWTVSKVFGGASVYHDRLIPPELLEGLKDRCVAETKACRSQARDQVKKKSPSGGLPIGVSRREFREMILRDAANPKGDLEQYVHRAAKVCGVVRGYRWPQ